MFQFVGRALKHSRMRRGLEKEGLLESLLRLPREERSVEHEVRMNRTSQNGGHGGVGKHLTSDRTVADLSIDSPSAFSFEIAK